VAPACVEARFSDLRMRAFSLSLRSHSCEPVFPDPRSPKMGTGRRTRGSHRRWNTGASETANRNHNVISPRATISANAQLWSGTLPRPELGTYSRIWPTGKPSRQGKRKADAVAVRLPGRINGRLPRSCERRTRLATRPRTRACRLPAR
jgi:hypothetical protein